MFRNYSRGAGRPRAALLAGVVTSALILTACAGPGGGDAAPSPTSTVSQDDIDAALQEETTLTFWGWAPQDPGLVEAFQKEYPQVKVELQNQGNGLPHYTKLQNVIKAGSGIPDVAQIEYTALPQFALAESLVNLNEYGLDSMEEDFSGSSWTGVNTTGGLWGLPQDDGPLAFFYREDIFDSLGVPVPTTWDEYYAAAEAIHSADPTKFIGSDAGQAGLVNAQIWQAGGEPYKVSGEEITIDLQDEGTEKWAEMQSRLLDAGLMDTIPTFSPEWNTAITSDSYASWITGAWGAGSLLRRFPEMAGKWRVAPLPQYSDGEDSSGVQGGSATSVMAGGENTLAAIGFVQWISANSEANQLFVDQGGFPTATNTLTSDEWIDQEVPFFGGQKANQIFLESIEGVPSGWNFLPYALYSDSIFGDTVGQAYAQGADLNEGLQAWQDRLVDYGNDQGFTVNG